MTLQRRISRLEEQHYLDMVARIAAGLGVTAEEVLAEADRIVEVGIDAAEGQLMRDYSLSPAEVEAAKAEGRRLLERRWAPGGHCPQT